MRRLFSIVLCAALLVLNATAEAAGKPRDGGTRIRPQDPRSTQLLRDGVARSETFRALVDRIEASNVFVYVTVSPFIQPNLAGKLTWMTKAGPYRYLRATLSPHQTSDQMVSTLAHELQHAVEVIEDDLVTDEPTLIALYKRIGHPSSPAITEGWETIAAQEAGHRVRRELGDRTRASALSRRFDFTHV